MLSVRITVNGAESAVRVAGELADRLRRSPRPLIDDLAQFWVEEVFPSVFDRGGDPPWTPLSAVSVKLRGPSRPLKGEGILRNSFEILEMGDSYAVIGNELGEIHQLGGRTSEKSMIPGRTIPARPFLTLSEAVIFASLRKISEFYFGELP